ncbi:MAG: hypothetical protein NTV86_22445 [Planctomycetota bacterium]|nr:hypothetical protein [Planctomycetota bacterium]
MSRRPAGRNWGKDDPFHDPAYEAALAGLLREIAAMLGVPSSPAATSQPAATRPANPTGDAP